jgi:hypothetical protein
VAQPARTQDCGSPDRFDQSTGHYRDNLIAFAHLKS